MAEGRGKEQRQGGKGEKGKGRQTEGRGGSGKISPE